jgi:hypothetical protein
METSLKNSFKKSFNFEITKRHIIAIEKYTRAWEVYRNHPEALNGMLLAVKTISFTDKDKDYLFEIFDTDIKSFYNAIKQVDGIDLSNNTITDPYNLFCLWLSHLILNSNLPKKDILSGCFNVIKMLHYKLFSGLIRKYFEFPPMESVMEYTISQLDNSFILVKLQSWKAVIEDLVTRLVYDKNNKHHTSILFFSSDYLVQYVIANSYANLNSRIKVIANLFYKYNQENKAIDSYTLIGEIEGKKILKDVKGLENLVLNVTNQITNSTTFINHDDIKKTTLFVKKVREENVLRILNYFSDLAVQQVNMDKYNYEKTIQGEDFIIHLKTLTSTMLKQIYNICIVDKVDISKPLRILEKAFNTYSSSQIKDPEILKVKRSFDNFVINTKITVRLQSIVALRLALIIYLLFRSFNFITK